MATRTTPDAPTPTAARTAAPAEPDPAAQTDVARAEGPIEVEPDLPDRPEDLDQLAQDGLDLGIHEDPGNLGTLDPESDPFGLELPDGSANIPDNPLGRPGGDSDGDLMEDLADDYQLPAPDFDAITDAAPLDGRTHDAFDDVQGDMGFDTPGGGLEGATGYPGTGGTGGHWKTANDIYKVIEEEMNPSYDGGTVDTKPIREQGRDAAAENDMTLGFHQGGGAPGGSKSDAKEDQDAGSTDDETDSSAPEEEAEQPDFSGGVGEWVKSWFGKSEAEEAFEKANWKAEQVEKTPSSKPKDTGDSSGDDKPPTDTPADPEGEGAAPGWVPDKATGDLMDTYNAIKAGARLGSEINPDPNDDGYSGGGDGVDYDAVLEDPPDYAGMISNPGVDGDVEHTNAPTGEIGDDTSWYFDDAGEG